MNSRNHSDRVSVRFESLESRRLFSVSLNAAGWTVVTPSADTRTVYVSTSGNDANTGLSASAPVKTLGRAESLLRNGSPDWMLLKRGDTFSGSFPNWYKSGRGAKEPMLIGTYGSGARPVLATGVGNGFLANTKLPVNNLVIDGIQFYANQRDPNSSSFDSTSTGKRPTGLFLLGPSNNVLIEDCSFRFFKDNIVVEGYSGAISNITIRRSLVEGAYCVGDRAQGFYADTVNGVTLEENVFDHNGWNEKITAAADNGHNHNIYYSYSAANMVVRGNIISEGSSHGVLARSGGIIENNLFLRNAIGVAYGTANGATSTAGGVTGRINGNVFVDGKGIGATRFGQGIEIGNIKSLQVANNIFTHDTAQAQPAIKLIYANATSNPSAVVGINNVTIENNITSGWRNAMAFDAGLTAGGSGMKALNNLVIRNNDFQGSPSVIVRHANPFNSGEEKWSGNEYSSTNSGNNWFALPAGNTSIGGWQKAVEGGAVGVKHTFSDRTAATYNATQGGTSTLDAFMAQADKQSGDNWRTAYTTPAIIAYIRAGFGQTGTPQPTPATGSISGTVFNDLNANLKRESGEGTLSGWKVYIDENDNHKFDTGEQYATTDSKGVYKLDDVRSGYYVVRVIRPTGWTQTLPTLDMGQHITVATGQNVTGGLFGERLLG